MATIRDVARAAGVSIATVSRVYNNRGLVNTETVNHILNIAAQLDYWPNPAAQSLTTRRTHTFGVLLPDLFGEFYSEIIRGIDLVSHSHGYQMLLSSSCSSLEDVVLASRAMLGRIDGVIMMAPDQKSGQSAVRIRRKVPVVLLNPFGEIQGCHAVAVDNVHGAEEAVGHLIGLGHRKIAMVAGPEGNIDADDRRRGFFKALASAGMDPDEALIVPGDFREATGYKAGSAILGHSPQPTAVFAANDGMAIGLLAALRERGVDVPGDIALVGFDDITLARYMNPALTTVRVDAGRLGGHAVEMMLDVLASDKAETPRRLVLSTTLKIRQSCGALKPEMFTRRPQTEPGPRIHDSQQLHAIGEEEVQP